MAKPDAGFEREYNARFVNNAKKSIDRADKVRKKFDKILWDYGNILEMYVKDLPALELRFNDLYRKIKYAQTRQRKRTKDYSIRSIVKNRAVSLARMSKELSDIYEELRVQVPMLKQRHYQVVNAAVSRARTPEHKKIIVQESEKRRDEFNGVICNTRAAVNNVTELYDEFFGIKKQYGEFFEGVVKNYPFLENKFMGLYDEFFQIYKELRSVNTTQVPRSKILGQTQLLGRIANDMRSPFNELKRDIPALKDKKKKHNDQTRNDLARGKLNLSNKDVMRQVGVPFWDIASHFGIDLYPEDLEFFNLVKQDNVFQLLPKQFGKSGVARNNGRIKEVVLYEKWRDDERCTPGAKLVMAALVGNALQAANAAVLEMRRPYIERWFEKCR